jgi:hypothetical protein
MNHPAMTFKDEKILKGISAKSLLNFGGLHNNAHYHD